MSLVSVGCVAAGVVSWECPMTRDTWHVTRDVVAGASMTVVWHWPLRMSGIWSPSLSPDLISQHPPAVAQAPVQLETKVREDFTNTEKAPTIVQMQSSTNVDILRLELIQRGVSVSHPLIQGKIKIHPELQADLSMMFYYVLKPLQPGYKCFL